MEKRAVIAVGLSIAVFYLFSMLFGPEKKLEPIPQKGTSAAVGTVSKDQQTAPSAPLQVPANIQPPPSNIQMKEITVETDLYTAVFSSRGASLKSLTLNKYREEISESAKKVTLVSDSDPNTYSFATRATGINFPDNAVFMADSESVKVDAGGSRQLTFNYISGQGFTVRKVYTFTSGAYGIKLDTQLFNNSAAPLVGVIQHVLTYPAEPKVKNNRFDTAGSYLFSDNTLQADKIKDVAGASKRYDKTVQWFGFADKYFMNAILSDKNSIASVEPFAELVT
jgi:YidC/Oxa1 family membrane protein insertase